MKEAERVVWMIRFFTGSNLNFDVQGNFNYFSAIVLRIKHSPSKMLENEFSGSVTLVTIRIHLYCLLLFLFFFNYVI